MNNLSLHPETEREKALEGLGWRLFLWRIKFHLNQTESKPGVQEAERGAVII